MVLPDEELEKFILSKVGPYPKKVAFVVGAAILKFDISEEQAALAIYAMCEAGQLKPYGNISNWRHSEISLPDA